MSNKLKKCVGGMIPTSEGCGEDIFLKGMCKTHYDQWKANQDQEEQEALDKLKKKKKAQEEYKVIREKYREPEGSKILAFPVGPVNADGKLEIKGWETKDEITDKLAAELFLRTQTEQGFRLIQRDGDTLCSFDRQKGIWNTDDDSVRRLIMSSNINIYRLQHDKEKDIWVRGKEKGKEYRNYSDNVAGIKKIMECLRIVIEDTKFIEKNIETNKGKILFRNGIYYFDENKFENCFDPEIVFFHRIDRDFPERIQDDIKYVEHYFFDNLFNDLESSRYIKAMTARSIYGDYLVRKSLMCRGDTASGKGMLTEALMRTFPGLVQSFDANNLLFSKSTKDQAQKNMWLIPYKTARLLISNEMTMEVGENGKMKQFFDSNQFKRIVSGGDEIDVRGMNENISKMVNRANLFFLAQDFPEFMPKDNAVNDRKEDIHFPKSFILDPKYPNQFKRDVAIKEKTKDVKYQNALFFLMCDVYQKEVKGKDYFPPVHDKEFEEVLEEAKESESLLSIIEQKYNIVSNEEFDAIFKALDTQEKKNNKYVYGDEINAYIVSKLAYGDKKIGMEFKKLSKQLTNFKDGVEIKFSFESMKNSHNSKRYRSNIIRKDLI